MVVDLPNNLFGKRDVRDTPKNDPAASTALSFITVGSETDLTSNRVLTAGTGIDITDGGAGSNITISTESKTDYISIAPDAFRASDASNTSYNVDNDTLFITGTEDYHANISIPNGAVVTGIIVYGDASSTSKTFKVRRVHHDDSWDQLASTNIGTEDTTITYATIDNKNYSYAITLSSLSSGDQIWGARIKYTI